MTEDRLERYQLSGFDARERGLSRPVEFERTGTGIRAVLRYETTRIVTEERRTPAEALQELIRMIQAQGYSQLRTQQSDRNGTYLGSQEPWIDYPDPDRRPEQPTGLFARLLGRLR